MQSDSDQLIGASLSTPIYHVAIDSIRANRNQPRIYFDEQALDELMASIREHGLIQPLLVTKYETGTYELIAGERRWRAACRLGLSHVPVLIKDVTPQQLLEIALVENVQRADLNPLEEGRAYQTLKEEFGLKDDEIARRVGKSRVAIVNARRLLRLVPEAQKALIEGTISAGHGRALLRLEQPEQQLALLTLIQQADLSVRASERIADLCQHAGLAPGVCRTLLEGRVSSDHVQHLLPIADQSDQVAVLDAIVGYALDLRDTEWLCGQVAQGMSLRWALVRLRSDDPTGVVGTLGMHPGDMQSSEAEAGGAHHGTQYRSPEDDGQPSQGRVARGSTRHLDPDDSEIQRLFEEALATPVQLVRSGSTIKLTITLYSDEQLQGLYDLVVGVVSP